MNAFTAPDQAGSSRAADRSLWLPALEPRPNAALRLFTFPYAGGGTPVFRPWLNLLPGTIELRIAQLPGRGPRYREERFHQLPAALDALEPHLLPLLDRPFAFFGHSLGAVLAFEMARRLQKRGLAPVHLFLSGRNASQVPNLFPPIHQLPGDRFLEKVRELNGMVQAVLQSPELLEIVLPVIRSDFTLLETYEYRGPAPDLSCPIMAFGGEQDPQTTLEGLKAWAVQTTGSFDLRIIPGDHFFIDTDRKNLLAAIVEKLGDHRISPAGGTVA